MTPKRRVSAVFLFLWVVPAVSGLTPDPCSSPLNAIVTENCKTGNPSSEWNVSGSGDPSIQGFATEFSVNRGETVSFKIKTDAAAYRVDIYRLGYYQGNGARKVATINPSASLPQSQPSCRVDSATGLTDCGNWAVSASWSIPADLPSGVYFARPRRADTGGASHIFFVVRDDAGRSDILMQTSDTTWQAYNRYGAGSLYVAPSMPFNRAYKVSYNRPFTTRDYSSSWVLSHEHPMIEWLEANGYDVSYFSGIDSDRRGSLIRNHRAFLSVGHDEYWSGPQRAAVEAARDAGVHVAFFSGNEIYWKTRWESSIDGSGTPYRTLVCYKESSFNTRDPKDPPTWTGLWWDARFSPPADGGRPPNALSGTEYTVDAFRNDALVVSSEYSKHRFWRKTAVAALTAGTTTSYDHILGYEWDEDLDNGFRPVGLVQLSSATYDVPRRQLGPGFTYIPGAATHHLTLYRTAKGSLVFGAGTMQWPWGLDNHHDDPNTPLPPSRDLQQATMNLLADMGVLPASRQADLSPVSASEDFTAPVSRIVSPPDQSVVSSGTVVPITGTASDSGGGVVAAVEVSVDGGVTWHPASGREQWRYEWTPSGNGGRILMSRAVDDSGNLETPAGGVAVGVGGPPPPLPVPPAPSPAPNPLPALSVLNPSAATAGAAGLSLEAAGAGFVQGSTVQWNGSARATTFVSPQLLRAALTAADLASTGTARITVFNPSPGGGPSSPLTFSILPPSLALAAGGMRVFPNPWKADRHAGVPVTFDFLGAGSTVKIYTASGRWIKNVQAAANGRALWDLTNDSGEAVASGYYLFTATDSGGGSFHGKLAVLK